MSERREASNHRLALTIKQQQQQQDTSTVTAIPVKDSRRKRSSTSSNGTVTVKRPTPSRSRSAVSKTLPIKTDTDSSCVAQLSPTSPDKMSSVYFTKTGRVSKAKKGLKVHDCDCGRSYTRAEHLRRHQRNHVQEEAMVCKYPNCDKVFFRSDLLQRHEERHNEFGNAARQSSVSSTEHSAHTSPAPVPATLPMLPVSTLSSSSSSSYPQHQIMSPQLGATPFPSENKHQAMNYQPRHSISGPVMAEGTATSVPWHESFAQSPYSGSSGYATPTSGYDYSHIYATPPYGGNIVRTRTSSNASLVEQHWAQASQSPTSSVGMPQSWPSDEKSIVVSSFPYTTASYSTSDMPMHTSIAPMMHYAAYDPHNVVQMDIDEGVQLFPGDHYGMSQIARAFPSEQSLNNYWRLFHPTFPVVHRFTLTQLELSPMLYAAMIAIDLHYSNNIAQRQKARELHKMCVRLLSQREQMNRTGCDRLCDLQAIFLVEVFAQYCAQRCSKMLSARFDVLYKKLASVQAISPSAGAVHDLHLFVSPPEESIEERWIQWTRSCAKQHLLLSCFILEAQQSTLLARDREPSLRMTTDNLPFPIHESWWGAETSAEWTLIAHDQRGMPTTVGEALQPQSRGRYDLFQSTVLITSQYDHANASGMNSTEALQDLLSNSSTTRLQLLTAKLAQLVPTKALLSVSGETWVLGTKLTSEHECSELRSALQTWIGQLWSCSADDYTETTAEAMRVSIAILELSLETDAPLALGLGNELGVFVAALVIWAATAAASDRAMISEVPSQPSQSLQPYAVTKTHTSNLNYSMAQTTYQDSTHISLKPRDAFPAPLYRRSSIPYAEIYTNCAHFLPLATNDFTSLNMAACYTGCTSILLWAKMHLRGAFRDERQTANPSASSSGHDNGELINAVVGQIEKMLERGWEGWGI